MNKDEFYEMIDKLENEKSHPNMVIVHPLIWNGYWFIKKHPKIISKIFRFLGRKLKSRRIYWVGFPIVWMQGMKEFVDPNIIPEEIDIEGYL